MTDLTRISVTATAEAALKKLKRAEIGVYDCKKEGARFIFSVKDKQLKKAFAIFKKPCYNIVVASQSRRKRLLNTLTCRAGLIAGAFVIAVAAAISNLFVFKITVGGSGSYLSPEVKRIIYESGVKEFKPFSGLDIPAATGKILALPQVTFCNIEKRGSVLHVDVRVDEEHGAAADRQSLVADRDGVVRSVSAICGTAEVASGSAVKRGDTLIAAYTTAGEKTIDCLAVGFVELECSGKLEYFAYAESDESLKAAYSSVRLHADNVISRSHTVAPADGGVTYIIEFSYLHKLSINME